MNEQEEFLEPNFLSDDALPLSFTTVVTRVILPVTPKKIDPEYGQDLVNRIGLHYYDALLQTVRKFNPRSILDAGGGTGNLTRFLSKEFNLDFIRQAISNGIEKDRTLFSICSQSNIHQKIFSSLNEGGRYIDFSTHVPNREIAEWLIRWVNIKDHLAGLNNLVQNRRAYTEWEIIT